MAPTATNPKIEELRLRLKADPKSRLFFPLAEELRKVGGLAEAEQVLRTGLGSHPTYLSAWVSLGRGNVITIGGLILIPSLWLLFRVFKARNPQART